MMVSFKFFNVALHPALHPSLHPVLHPVLRPAPLLIVEQGQTRLAIYGLGSYVHALMFMLYVHASMLMHCCCLSLLCAGSNATGHLWAWQPEGRAAGASVQPGRHGHLVSRGGCWRE